MDGGNPEGTNPLDSIKDRLSSLQDEKEKPLIEPTPSLRYISKAADILRLTKDSKGKAIKDSNDRDIPHWTDLSSDIEGFENVLDLSDKIRNVVRDYVERKIPYIKSGIPPLAELDDKALLNALTHNWFSEISEVDGQRREVLLTVMAHIVKRMETKIYQDVISKADVEGLTKLGIDVNTRDLLVDLLDVSMKSDPLFVRFLAFSQKSGRPGEGATETTFTLPEKEGEFTLHQLFPKETGVLSNRFRRIVDNSSSWSDKPGAEVFKKYLLALSDYYHATDTTEAAKHQVELEKLHKQTIEQGFPIILSPSGASYIKEPYHEPELIVSIPISENSPEDKAFKTQYKQIQRAMADSLSVLDAGEDVQKLEGDIVRVVAMLGGYGSNLRSNTVAVDVPFSTLYLNEQIRTYDREFPDLMKEWISADTYEAAFKNLSEAERRTLQEKMSRLLTIMHEFSHRVGDYTSEGAKRVGETQLTTIEESKAEIVFKALMPNIIEKSSQGDNIPIDGNREQWALAILTGTCQLIKDSDEGDPDYAAGAYSLNSLFKSGAVTFENNKITVKDFDLLYEQLKGKAREILGLYKDDSMNKNKSSQWIKQECKPREEVKKLHSFLTGESEEKTVE